MPTSTTLRAETRTITITAPATTVHRFVSDPANLPRWAPDFASHIREENGRWLVETPRGEAEIVVSGSVEQGTVDVRAAADPRPRVCSRVIASGEGSEYLFTQFFPRDAGEPAVSEQMTIVEEELQAVRDLCESPA